MVTFSTSFVVCAKSPFARSALPALSKYGIFVLYCYSGIRKEDVCLWEGGGQDKMSWKVGESGESTAGNLMS